jgi:hypothetical protein
MIFACQCAWKSFAQRAYKKLLMIFEKVNSMENNHNLFDFRDHFLNIFHSVFSMIDVNIRETYNRERKFNRYKTVAISDEKFQIQIRERTKEFRCLSDWSRE